MCFRAFTKFIKRDGVADFVEDHFAVHKAEYGEFGDDFADFANRR